MHTLLMLPYDQCDPEQDLYTKIAILIVSEAQSEDVLSSNKEA